jgi:hypothetical protein
MAGSYPDHPSWRMAWDRDGSACLLIPPSTGLPQDLSAAEMQALNDEGPTAARQFGWRQGVWDWCVIIFPELRDLDGFFVQHTGSYAVQNMMVSSDTTNGVDGTWVVVNEAPFGYNGLVKPNYRTLISSSTVLDIKGLKFQAGFGGLSSVGNIQSIHLYGEPSPGANPDRLEIWHPTLDERVPPAWFDWGDAPRGSSADIAFRVKNLSPSLTAHSIRVFMDVLTDAVPSVPAQHLISQGGSYLAQQNIGTLTPGAISAPLTARRITPSNAVLSLWDFRILADTVDWED